MNKSKKLSLFEWITSSVGALIMIVSPLGILVVGFIISIFNPSLGVDFAFGIGELFFKIFLIISGPLGWCFYFFLY